MTGELKLDANSIASQVYDFYIVLVYRVFYHSAAGSRSAWTLELLVAINDAVW